MELIILRKTFPVHILKTNKKLNVLLAPVYGIFLFIVLYIVATLLYPGGSQIDARSKGFSWINNYWCNLLNENAINGQHNPARPIALVGMLILCFALSFFWYVFPRHLEFKKFGRLTIQVSGMLSMIIAMFLFTTLHDAIINTAAFFGLIALAGTFIGLYNKRGYWLLCFGIFNLLLVALNNYVYYTKGLLIYLPVIQKFSFALFLIWICCISVSLYVKARIDLSLKPQN